MKNYGLTPSQTGGLGRTYMYFTGTPDLPVRLRPVLHQLQVLPRHASPSVRRERHGGVSFDVTNTGTTPGATVAQLYVAPQFTVPGMELPKSSWRGSSGPMCCAPGQTQHITLTVKVAGLSQWDE